MFDPYHKWLGIPPAEQPPTLYRLLGISPGEQDREVIEEASLRQTAHVRTYQIGAYAAQATRLLNEIAKARTILTNPAKKLAYDAHLAESQPTLEADVIQMSVQGGYDAELVQAPPPIAPPPMAYPPSLPVQAEVPAPASAWHMPESQEEAEPLLKVSRKKARRGSPALAWVVVIGAAFAALGLTIYFLLPSDSGKGKGKKGKGGPNGAATKKIGEKSNKDKEEPVEEEGPEDPPVALGPEWERIYNGRDLGGWRARLEDPKEPIAETFKIGKDEVLSCGGVTRGFLESTASYKDFDLHLEFRFPIQGRTEPRYSSAALVFRTAGENPFNARELLEVSLGLKDLGNLTAKGVDLKTAKGSVNPANKDIRRTLKPVPSKPGKWQVLRLSAQGDKVTVKINDQVVNEGTGAPKITAPLRFIYRGTEIQLRNLAVKGRD